MKGCDAPNAAGIVQPLGKQGVCHTVALPFTFKSILDFFFKIKSS
jgi:hypothetical protein